jgi:hypothetical protein
MPAAVVNGGRAIITNRLRGSGTDPLYIAVGTGSTAVATSQTALVTEVDSRVTGTSAQATTSTTNDTHRVTGTYTCGATPRTIAEVGTFDAASSGNMFIRAVLDSTIALVSGDSIAFTINMQVTSSVA